MIASLYILADYRTYILAPCECGGAGGKGLPAGIYFPQGTLVPDWPEENRVCPLCKLRFFREEDERALLALMRQPDAVRVTTDTLCDWLLSGRYG